MPQTLWVDQHVVLLDVTALRIDFSHTRNRAQQRAQYPVLHHASLGEFFLREFTFAIVGMLKRVLIHLAQARRNRAQHRRNAWRQTGADLHQAFHHQLTCKVNIGGIGEHQGDERQARFVERAQFGQTGQSGHGHFDGHGGKPFNFFG